MTMTRCTLGLLVTLALGLLVAPLAAHAQPPTHAALAKITFTYMGNSAGAEVRASRP
jgi:hypothetical protein